MTHEFKNIAACVESLLRIKQKVIALELQWRQKHDMILTRYSRLSKPSVNVPKLFTLERIKRLNRMDNLVSTLNSVVITGMILFKESNGIFAKMTNLINEITSFYYETAEGVNTHRGWRDERLYKYILETCKHSVMEMFVANYRQNTLCGRLFFEKTHMIINGIMSGIRLLNCADKYVRCKNIASSQTHDTLSVGLNDLPSSMERYVRNLEDEDPLLSTFIDAIEKGRKKVGNNRIFLLAGEYPLGFRNYKNCTYSTDFALKGADCFLRLNENEYPGLSLSYDLLLGIKSHCLVSGEFVPYSPVRTKEIFSDEFIQNIEEAKSRDYLLEKKLLLKPAALTFGANLFISYCFDIVDRLIDGIKMCPEYKKAAKIVLRFGVGIILASPTILYVPLLFGALAFILSSLTGVSQKKVNTLFFVGLAFAGSLMEGIGLSRKAFAALLIQHATIATSGAVGNYVGSYLGNLTVTTFYDRAKTIYRFCFFPTTMTHLSRNAASDLPEITIEQKK